MKDWLAKYWLAAAFGAVSGFLGWVVKKLWGRQKAMDAGILALLHSELYKECEMCEQKGYATVDDLKNIEYLYKPYHALGGNGTGTLLYERVKKLPDKPAEKETA